MRPPNKDEINDALKARLDHAEAGVKRGVSELAINDGQELTPHELRQGIVLEAARTKALAHLLIKYGILKYEEWQAAQADVLEKVVKEYEEKIFQATGNRVKLEVSS